MVFPCTPRGGRKSGGIFLFHNHRDTRKTHHVLKPDRLSDTLLLVRSVSSGPESGGVEDDDVIPPNCSRYKVKLQKPLGLVLEETREGIRVAEVQPGGNAERLGMISPRDQLIATSGFIRTTQQVYGETTVQGGERMIRLNVRGESWDTVMAAISSHLAGMEVELEFQKCSDEE